MMRILCLRAGLWAGLLVAAGCQVAAQQRAARKEATRTNALPTKHITESPTLERPAPRPVPGP